MADAGDLIVNRYRLINCVGGGAMGVVWRAHDTILERDVAVKELLIQEGMTDAQVHEANQRALREGRIAARLHHPHAISVYEVVEHDGRPCLIMEFLPSRSLSDLIAEQRVLPVEQVRRIGAQIAAALAAAHAAGIVHRDVKPGNVLLADDGTAKLTDFGISRAAGDSTITATGILAGTPAYLAPEVAKGEEAGYPSDVYSLGATLYCAVEGTPPFGLDPNPIALLYRIANNPVPPPRQAGPLSDTLERLLRAEPGRRVTADQAEHALAKITPVEPPPPPVATAGRTRRRGILVALVLGVMLVTGVLIALMNDGGAAKTAGGPPHTVTRAPAPPAPAATATTTPKAAVTTPSVPQDITGQPANAITGYYQLVPGDLGTAWGHMTADYQQNHAGGMTGYQQFWQPIARVSLSGMTANPPDTVTVTITYVYRNGNVVVERTQFGLIQQDGMWKIASSSVLTHSGSP
ncbi:MAG TPA: serine/threonine-protein kinase [Pseudonocardiaceae bacterium]